MRMASFFYRGLFEIEDIRIPEKVTKKSDLSKSDSFEDAIAGFMTSNDLLSSTILYRGQKYTADELVVIEVVDMSRIAVGIIKSILIRGSSVYFIVKKVFANRVKLNFFVSEINDEDKVIFAGGISSDLGILNKVYEGVLNENKDNVQWKTLPRMKRVIFDHIAFYLINKL